MSDNVRLWMGAFKSMSDTERGYGSTFFTLYPYALPHNIQYSHCNRAKIIKIPRYGQHQMN